MSYLGRITLNQAKHLLDNKMYAWFLMSVTAVLPYCGWMALVIMCLVTLRQGLVAGFKCMLIGVTTTLCFIQLLGVAPDLISNILATYILCFVSASVLKATYSWQWVGGVTVSLLAMILLGIQLFNPAYIMYQYQALQTMIATLVPDNDMTTFLSHQSASGQLRLANYLMGIKAASLVISALFSLMLARSIQAKLFNPGGFKQEILQFRANRMGVLMLAICLIGVYQHTPQLLSLLPVFFIYLLAAGVCLLLNLLTGKKPVSILVILLVPVMLVPYIMLPAYVLVGSIDSIFNLRQRLPLMGRECQNKG